MNSFIFCTRVLGVGLALLVTLSVPGATQDRDSLVRRCLSIADVNERVDCLETGRVPDSGAATNSSANPWRQLSGNPSFDCAAARSLIERAICGDITLSDWDSRMGRLFQQALRLTKDRQSLVEGQRLWLIQRDRSCSTVLDTAIWSCLLEMTKSRAAALAQMDAPGTVAPVVQASPAIVTPTTSSNRTDGSSDTALSSSMRASTSPNLEPNRSTGSASGDNSSFIFVTLLIALVLGLAATIAVRANYYRKQRLATEKHHLAAEQQRFAEIRRLVTKYGEEAAAKILAHEVWQGMTCEQLVESRGNPSNVGREIIREKIRETWKYQQTGRNRFRERIYLENGIVIGWKY